MTNTVAVYPPQFGVGDTVLFNKRPAIIVAMDASTVNLQVLMNSGGRPGEGLDGCSQIVFYEKIGFSNIEPRPIKLQPNAPTPPKPDQPTVPSGPVQVEPVSPSLQNVHLTLKTALAFIDKTTMFLKNNTVTVTGEKAQDVRDMMDATRLRVTESIKEIESWGAFKASR